MANKKISAFDTISTIAGGPINLNDVLGVAAYCDDPSAPGTDVNVSFSGQDIIDSFIWTRNSNADNIYYDTGSVNIGTTTNFNNIPLTIAGTGTSGMSTAMNVFDSLEVSPWFTLRDDRKLFYLDGNESTDFALTCDNLGMATWAAVVNSIDFGTTGLTPNSATAGAVGVAGTLVVGHGGTGLTSYTIGDIIYADTASTLTQLNAGTAGDVLTSNGAGLAPSYQTPSGGAQKFVLTLAYAFDQTTTTFTVRNLAWNGNVNMSGASTTSVDDGSWYVNNSFNITKVVARYAGRNSLTMGGTDNLTLELKYLTPSSVGPNSWSAVSNEPASPSTLITDFGNNLDLALADNGTWPWKTFTPGAPITITADTMLVCTATETSSITPTNTDYFVQIYCEYV